MEIRIANKDDISRIMDIYARARQFMAENGNPHQWGRTNWPPESLILEDIEKGHCRVCEDDGTIVGVFYYNYGKAVEPSYAVIEEGEWIGGDTYGVVHRIASDGSRRGVGTFCLDKAFECCGDLRIDTHPDNHVMQDLLSELGFRKCGIVHVEEDDDPRFAYEKLKLQSR